MKVKINNELRAPMDSIQEVYLKINNDKDVRTWYIIPFVEGHDRDGSPLERRDMITYQHPDATEENGFIRGEYLPNGFTYIHGGHCSEIDEIKTNQEAKSLLEEEW